MKPSSTTIYHHQPADDAKSKSKSMAIRDVVDPKEARARRFHFPKRGMIAAWVIRRRQLAFGLMMTMSLKLHQHHSLVRRNFRQKQQQQEGAARLCRKKPSLRRPNEVITARLLDYCSHTTADVGDDGDGFEYDRRWYLDYYCYWRWRNGIRK